MANTSRKRAEQTNKLSKEISQPAVIIALILVVIAVGVFGWLKLRTPVSTASSAQVKANVQAQTSMMLNAFRQMQAQQGMQQGAR